MSDVMIKGEPRMMQNCTHKQLILGQQVRGHTFPGTNGFWVVFFLVTSHQKHTLTVPCSQFIHSSIHWQTDFSSRSELSEQLADFAKWHGVNQCNWGLLTSSTDNCLETTVFKQKLPLFRRLHGLTVMKGLQKQKHLITIVSFLLLARSTVLVLLLKWQPPLKRLPWGVPSCPDRGIFSSICPPN